MSALPAKSEALLPVRGVKRTERGYLAAVIREVSTRDVSEVARAIVKDAIDGDERTRNAAREWLLKACLGGGRLMPSDVYNPPVIRKSR